MEQIKKLYPKYPYVTVGAFYNYKRKLLLFGNFGRNSAIFSLDDTTLTEFQRMPYAGVGPMGEWNGKLVIAGNFGNVNGVKAYGVALWDGVRWSNFFGSDTLLVDSTWGCAIPVQYKGQSYLYGNINPHGKPLISEIARFDGQYWRDVGGGIQGGSLADATCALVWRNELYVAGQFMERDGAPGNAIARWDGTSWHTLGTGLAFGGHDAFIYDMAVYHDNLYVVGGFTSAGGVAADKIARWDGEKWCSLDAHFNNNATLLRLAVFKDALYVAGRFTSINGDTSYNNIAEWTGGDYVSECGPASPTAVSTPPAAQFQILPNPASTELSVATWAAGDVCITDAVGRQMACQAARPNAISSFNVANWPAGVYFVHFKDKMTTYTGRFVKQ